MNLFIADNFFKQNPTKVLGEQSTRKGRFGSDMIVVQGDISNIQNIDAEPVPTGDLYPSYVPTFVTEEKAIETVFETEVKKEVKEKTKRMRGEVKPKAETAKQEKDAQEVYSYREISDMYNKTITRDEMEAYYFCNPDLNYKLLFDNYTNTKDQLIEKNLICYDHELKAFVYYYSYVSGNVNKKISALKRDEQQYIDVIGKAQYDKQVKMLESVKPKPKGFVGNDKIILLPHSNLSKDVKITELRYGKPELYGETTIFQAFKQWLRYIPSDYYEKSTYREIIEYYLDNKAPQVSKNLSKEQREIEEKRRINSMQRSKEEGDRLFEKFLAEELLPEDQARLSYVWNEKFNSIVEPDLTKIPVCFRMSKTFKSADKPLRLNPTQRQAVAFMMEKKSGLLAYGVGVGKSLSAIVCMSQCIDNGLSKYPCLIVPTNTYDKWLAEIQGRVDKETGKFVHGALPHLPPIQGLYNLNPSIVYEKLKIYSDDDKRILDSIQEAITFISEIEGDVILPAKREKINKIYPNIFWQGLELEYQSYLEDSKAKNVKLFPKFVADFLKEEYNYQIYQLGEIRKFPEGTIFVITEVGLQRLGVREENKFELTDRLYSILSQGELSADKDSKRDVAALQSKIEQTVSSSMKNAKLNIEDLGIDFACFDEAHYYKKLFTYVKGQATGEEKDWKSGEMKVSREKSKYEIKSGQYPSSRALSAFVLSNYVQSKNKNRNVLQLTATPFTNSPLEVFSMLTLTNYAALEDLGVANMIDFFDTFMRITYDIKYTPQKTVVKDVSLTGYNNLSQLRQIIYSLMDKKDEGANIIRPNKIVYPSMEKGIETTILMTSEQEELMAEVKKYINGKADYDMICQQAMADEIENLDFDALDDEVLIAEWERTTGGEYAGEREGLTEAKREQLIKAIKNKRIEGVELGEEDLSEDESLGVKILKGLSMMRQITLSPYLYYKACQKSAGQQVQMPNYKDYVNSSPKFKYVMGCVASVINWHKKTNTRISGQVIYMNIGTEYFPLLKEYIVKEIGLRESQVGIVFGGMSKSAKESVKNKFLSGEILVVIGSSTISVGVDLQNNATVLYNCYYDWNPTDAQQIEGRIWRQGNRFANVRIVYPMCYNSADPVLFEYLNSKTLRINEIWNRSSEVQELDLRDFNPKELQKKLITDPEEKAEFEMLMESEVVESKIIYYQNRRDSLSNALRAYSGFTQLKPTAITYLNELAAKKAEIGRREAIKNQKEKIAEIADKYSDDTDKMATEIAKYKASRYDHENDPEGKYAVEDYNNADNAKIYADAAKYLKVIDDWGWRAEDLWGSSLVDKQYKMKADLQKLRGDYKEMMAAEDKILKPLGLSFETASNPIVDLDAKLKELEDQLNAIKDGKDERVKRLKEEMMANMVNMKTVEDRVKEFASANDKLLSELMVLGENLPKQVEEPRPEETIVPEADQKLKEEVTKEEENVNEASKEFTFMKSNPMQRARALNVLEKRINADGKVMFIYEWIEQLPKDLEIGESKIYSSKSEKGYVLKLTIGNFIANSKSEIDYYKYIVEGGYPYSSYLIDEKIKQEEEKEKKKAQAEIERKEYEKKQQESAIAADNAMKRQIKDLIENGVEPLINRTTKAFKAELAELKSKRQTESTQKEMQRLEMYIEQAIRQANSSYEIATKLYKIVDGEVVKKYNWKVGDKVLWDGKVETEIEEITKNQITGEDKYKVKKTEGVYNQYISYNGLFPVKEVEQKEIINRQLTPEPEQPVQSDEEKYFHNSAMFLETDGDEKEYYREQAAKYGNLVKENAGIDDRHLEWVKKNILKEPNKTYDENLAIYAEKYKKEVQKPIESAKQKALNQIKALNLSMKYLSGDALAKAQARLKSLEISVKFLK